MVVITSSPQIRLSRACWIAAVVGCCLRTPWVAQKRREQRNAKTKNLWSCFGIHQTTRLCLFPDNCLRPRSRSAAHTSQSSKGEARFSKPPSTRRPPECAHSRAKVPRFGRAPPIPSCPTASKYLFSAFFVDHFTRRVHEANNPQFPAPLRTDNDLAVAEASFSIWLEVCSVAVRASSWRVIHCACCWCGCLHGIVAAKISTVHSSRCTYILQRWMRWCMLPNATPSWSLESIHRVDAGFIHFRPMISKGGTGVDQRRGTLTFSVSMWSLDPSALRTTTTPTYPRVRVLLQKSTCTPYIVWMTSPAAGPRVSLEEAR